MSSVRGLLIVVSLVAIAPAPVRGAAGDTLAPPPPAPGAPEMTPAAPASPPPDAAMEPASPPPDAAVAPAPSAPPLVASPPPKAAEPAPVLVAHPSPPAGGRSIVSKRWFWITIGAVIAAGAVGGFLLFRGSPKDPTASLGPVDGN